MDLLLESLTNDKLGENGRRTRVKTFTGPHSRFRGSIKEASFVVGQVCVYVTIQASRNRRPSCPRRRPPGATLDCPGESKHVGHI